MVRKNKKQKITDIAKETKSQNLSAVNLENIEEKILTAINNQELQKGIERWIRNNGEKQKELNRDLGILSSIISEYLDSYILFGYNLEGERVIIQSQSNPKDRDALMEFLKIVFIKNHHQPDSYE
jgi:predicted XRE-type DNA-binding protein